VSRALAVGHRASAGVPTDGWRWRGVEIGGEQEAATGKLSPAVPSQPGPGQAPTKQRQRAEQQTVARVWLGPWHRGIGVVPVAMGHSGPINDKLGAISSA